MKNSTAPTLDPKMLGFWMKCLRETQHLSQDALAASCGLDVRTIQRVESGKGASVTTRRCLARGLGYENHDTFDDPQFVATVSKLLDDARAMGKAEQARKRPEHIQVKATRVENGESLLCFAEAVEAVTLTADPELSRETKQASAALFDYVRDLQDLGMVSSYSERLGYSDDLESMLRNVEGFGAAVYSSFRPVKITNDSWQDKTPMPLQIGYLVIVPATKVLADMFVPRRFKFGF